jgi:predicted amidophosphoribosyltransferase
MQEAYIRIWQTVDLDEVCGHLLVIGELSGNCANCRQVGIDIEKTSCPNCKTEFKYIASRLQGQGRFKKIKQKRPDLIFIDYTDFQKVKSRAKARQFFA